MRIKCLLIASILFTHEAMGQLTEFNDKLREGFLYWNSYPITIDTEEATCSSGLSYPAILGNESPTQVAAKRCTQLTYLFRISEWIANQQDSEEKAFFEAQASLAIWLSGLDPAMQGSYFRRGLWQLSIPVALRYGLRVDRLVDERLDIRKVTQAAHRYYADLEARYGTDKATYAFLFDPTSLQSTYLVDSIRQQVVNELDALSDFQQSMPSSKVTPKTTKLPTEYISFDKAVRIETLITAVQIKKNLFHRLNPSLLGSVIPADYGTVELPTANVTALDKQALISSSQASIQKEQQKADSVRKRILSGVPDPSLYDVITHVVRSGESLGTIARRYGVSVASLKKWNNRKSNLIHPRQKLVVYLRKGSVRKKTPVEQKASPKPAQDRAKPLTASDQYDTYTVKQGDTLWNIAQQYEGVSYEDIMQWNAIENERIDIGQVLKIKRVSK